MTPVSKTADCWTVRHLRALDKLRAGEMRLGFKRDKPLITRIDDCIHYLKQRQRTRILEAVRRERDSRKIPAKHYQRKSKDTATGRPLAPPE